MARRPKQLQDEIEAALAEGKPHPEATVTDWKRRVTDIQRQARTTSDLEQRQILQRQLVAANDGLRAAHQTAAHKPTFVTSTNLFALKSMVLQHGPVFSSRVPAVDAPHLKRVVAAGLLEVDGKLARLTPAGCEALAEVIIQDIAEERRWQPRENTLVPPEKRHEILVKDIAEHETRMTRLETALAKITNK